MKSQTIEKLLPGEQTTTVAKKAGSAAFQSQYLLRDTAAGFITGAMAIPLTVGIAIMSDYPIKVGLATVAFASFIGWINAWFKPGNYSGSPGIAAGLAPVLATVQRMLEARVHVEITSLVIPTLNDSDEMLDQLFGWVAEYAGADIPLHLSRFFPAFRMTHLPPTPLATLLRAR